MAIAVTMPQMGESVVEGTLERWLVAEGDRVEKDQNLCEITTDKVDAEVPAPEAGVVTQLLVAVGQTVEVGTELLIIDPTGTVAAGKAGPEKTVPEAAAASAPEIPAPAAPLGSADVRATPLAGRVAADRGVDLSAVSGTGVGGRVTRSDVMAHPGARPAKPAAEAAAPGTLGAFLAGLKVPTYTPREGDNVVPFSTIRRRVAEHMIVSKVVSPHVGTLAEVDLSKLVALRDARKGEFRAKHGFNLTYLPFIVAATVRVLQEFPRMNAAVFDGNIVERNEISIGVAVETERGLLVPVIRNADRLSMTGIAEAIESLASRARNREITADELQGGTFTLSNPGREGNLYGFAVINQPQVGILRMGEIKKRVVVVTRDGEDTLAIHPMMYLALSYDHRIIDGVTGNSFLYRTAQKLEDADFEI